MKTLYTILDRDTKSVLVAQPTFERVEARASKMLLKQAGVDAVILATKLDKTSGKFIR